MGFLVLSRRPDDAITIGDDVRIMVVDVRGPVVRLGIDAPVAMPVHRLEVYDAILREKGVARLDDLEHPGEAYKRHHPRPAGSEIPADRTVLLARNLIASNPETAATVAMLTVCRELLRMKGAN